MRVNHRLRAATDSLFFNQFEREDAVLLKLKSGITPGSFVRQGDTLCVISSPETERLLEQLSGELRRAVALVSVSSTGEKEAIVKSANERVEYARAQRDGHQKTLERMKALFDRGIISKQEYDVVATSGEMYNALVTTAQAELKAVSTGAKPSEIAMNQAGVRSFENQIAVLQAKLDRFSLKAPFDGIVYETSIADTMAFIGSRDSFVVVMPIRIADAGHVQPGATINVDYASTKALRGTVHTVGSVAHHLGNEAYVLATILLESDRPMFPGEIVSCSLDAPSRSVGSFILRALKVVE